MIRHTSDFKLRALTAGLLLCVLACLSAGLNELPALSTVIVVEVGAPDGLIAPLANEDVHATHAGLTTPSTPRAPPPPV